MSAVPMMKNTAAPAAPAAGALAKLLAPLAPRWQALAPRERTGLTLAAAALAILLLWTVGIAPALRTLRTVPAQRAALEAQRQVMQRQASEAAQLRQQPPISPGQSEAALRAATEQLGSTAKLATSPERATVTLENIAGPTLVAWLAEVRTAARARVVEAQLTRNDKGYSGSVVLSLPRP